MTTLKRSRELPDVPTLNESGLQRFRDQRLVWPVGAGTNTAGDHHPAEQRVGQDPVEGRGRPAAEQARLRSLAHDARGIRQVSPGGSRPLDQGRQAVRHQVPGVTTAIELSRLGESWPIVVLLEFIASSLYLAQIFMLTKIVSGGQTGVDRGALEAALEAGFSCGGWCPQGRMAEDGAIAERYPLVELAGALRRTHFAERARQRRHGDPPFWSARRRHAPDHAPLPEASQALQAARCRAVEPGASCTRVGRLRSLAAEYRS